MRLMTLVVILTLTSVTSAQHDGHGQPALTKEEPPTTQRKLPYKSGWPKPVMDDMKVSYFEFENLEWFREGAGAALRWDAIGWNGGPKQRTWFKSTGEQSFSGNDLGKFDLQFLNGYLVAPTIDFVYGLRYDVRNGSVKTRGQASAVVGFQGFLPYRFNVEGSLFISDEGKLAARLTGSYQMQLTQEFYLVPRAELNLAASRSTRMGIEPGIFESELGLRLRYEIRRELAPYVGYIWTNSKNSSIGNGGSLGVWVLGLRMWF